MVSNERVRVPMPHIVLCFQCRHHFHVLHVLHRAEDLEPMADRLTVLLLDGREVRCGTGYLFCLCHEPYSVESTWRLRPSRPRYSPSLPRPAIPTMSSSKTWRLGRGVATSEDPVK